MNSVAACIVVALFLSGFAFWKGRTAWHWFVFAVCIFGIVWLMTIVTLDFAGVRAVLDSRKLAVFAGVVTGIIILIILLSVPVRPRHHVASMRREPSP